ncbi:MlaD family protein [Nocardia asiatica]|uniref:MlaD family protein n=1 Tax=Nocardia asiatica TaxID=209252 RepID=UPI0024538ADF|nr:MlaD family protein [Nocardia asiatica]
MRMPAVLIAAAVVVSAVAGAAVHRSERPARTVCALFDDTFGLYPDAPVTIRGVAVGKVRAVVPDHEHVRVEMVLDERPLSARMRAAVVNSSILTDRRVELVDTTVRGEQALPAGRCVQPDRTATPVSVSDALGSFTGLLDDITRPGPDGSTPLRALLDGADRQLHGLGPALDRQLRQLSEVLAAPDTFVTQLGELLDNSAELSRFVAAEWNDIKTSMITFGPGLALLERTLVIVKILVGKLAAALGPLDRLFNHHFPYLMEVLESSVPIVTLARTRAEESRDLLATIPGVVIMMRSMLQGGSGGIAFDYRPSAVVVGAADAQAFCASPAISDTCEAISAHAARMPLPVAVLATAGSPR